MGVIGPTLGVALSHHENRYLIPAVPLLAAIAAGGLAPPARAAHTRRRTLLALAVCALFLGNVSAVGATLARDRAAIAGHWLVARAAERFADNALALDQYAAMTAIDPKLSEPEARRAAIAAARGDTTAALAAADRALALDPDDVRARASAIMLLRDSGQADKARPLARAVAVAPVVLAAAWAHPSTNPPAALTLDGTDTGFARGFYGPEPGEGGRVFRWIPDTAQLRLATPPQGTAATLVLVLASPRPPGDPPPIVQISANGHPLGSVTVRRELGWNTIRLPLPRDLNPDTPLTIALQTTTTRRADDRRAFGIAVATVALEAAP